MNNAEFSTGHIYLTLDIDWAPDPVLIDTLEFLESRQWKATWFATHETPFLDMLRNTGGHEIGIHPNFNPLLKGEQPGESVDTIVDRCLSIVPEATSVRSHSLTQSSQVIGLFSRKGVTHEVNTFIPYEAFPIQKPWADGDNLVRVPFGWADDLYFSGEHSILPGGLSDIKPLCVLCLHPIHIFMNTHSPGFYDVFKPNYHDAAALRIKRRPDSAPGVKRFLLDFLDQAKSRNLGGSLISSLSPGHSIARA
ncbi:MAG: hypothetical protein RH946_11790 [Rhodospirillales bacterium]